MCFRIRVEIRMNLYIINVGHEFARAYLLLTRVVISKSNFVHIRFDRHTCTIVPAALSRGQHVTSIDNGPATGHFFWLIISNNIDQKSPSAQIVPGHRAILDPPSWLIQSFKKSRTSVKGIF